MSSCLLLLLTAAFFCPVRTELLCSGAEEIRGGQVEYPGDRRVGSVLQYVCPPRTRAQPVSWRVCGRDGRWSPLRTARTAACVPLHCSGPITLENGWFSPRKALYNIGDSVEFSCAGGLTLFGSPNRTCLPTGKWSGQTTFCDAGASLCQNPGVPMGGQRVGRRFEEGDRVRYTCYKSLVLLGSVYRTCLEDGSWSGLEPRCEDPHSYDEPETVAKHLKFSEEILLNPDKEIHIYFVIKASSSVGTENLKKALLFVDNLSGMVMASSGQVKCSLVLFGSSAREMVPLTSNQVAMEMEDTDNVTDFLEQPGVNTGEALTVVLQSVRRNPTGKQIVILVTDGRHNMGPSPYSVMRNLTNAIPEPDKHLDVFAIGLGDASKEELDRISSSQRAEQRSFYLPDYSALDRVLPEASSDSCGIRGEKTFQYKRVFGGVNARDKQWPWQVLLKMKSDGSWKPKGGGSIISRRWVLTAAHVLMCRDVVCGAADVTVVAGITRRTDSQGSDLVVEEVIVHEMYKDNESYIYDIGLLKLKEDIVFGERKRPVCLPCTADLSQVLSLPALDWRSRCEHQDLIFTGRGGEDYRTVNGFVTGWGKIKMRRCMEDNLQYGSITVQSREKCGTILPDVPFTAEKLCANGNNVDACKGDSGGPFVIKRNGRWIQIGIVSYGDKDCTNGSTGFYVNVARMMEWIRGKVGEDLQFA